MEKAMAGDDKDGSFFIPVRWNKRSVVPLFTRKRGKHEGNNCVEEDVKAMDSAILVKIGWSCRYNFLRHFVPNEPLTAETPHEEKSAISFWEDSRVFAKCLVCTYACLV